MSDNRQLIEKIDNAMALLQAARDQLHNTAKKHIQEPQKTPDLRPWSVKFAEFTNNYRNDPNNQY